MKYLVDTDYVISYLLGRPDAVTLLDTLTKEGAAVSIITYAEIYEGIYAGRNPQQAEKRFLSFLRGLKTLGITPAVAKMNAKLRGELRAKHLQTRERALDLFIAATALTHRLTLVTNNVRDYTDIPQLSLYPLESLKKA